MRLPVNHLRPLAAFALIAAAGAIAGAKPAPAPAVSGPAADYPVVLGESFTVEGKTYTPIDKLNYDEVGRASIGAGEGTSITAAHKTLPLPSYAEVTSLASGRTILVRVERRGPLSNDLLVELSPSAAAQLGVSAIEAVRVRRVNPPEPERAALRSGKQAPERMVTPKGLLDALNRKLQQAGGDKPVLAATPLPGPSVAKAAAESKNSPKVKPPADVAVAVQSKPVASEAKPQRAAPTGNTVVQAAAFSTRARADAAAKSLGGAVTAAGRLWRVRLGPFDGRAPAEAALAKARAAGYSDARIQRAD